MASPNPRCSAPAAPFTTDSARYWLPRKAVVAAVGGRYRLAKLERAGCLVRHYPAGLRRARYSRAQVMLCAWAVRKGRAQHARPAQP